MPGPIRTPAPLPFPCPVTPLPQSLPAGVREVVLFGGTFDPPHAAHMNLALAAREQSPWRDAWLIFVPAAQSPLKEHGPHAPERDRIEMLRLLLASHEGGPPPRTMIWTDEIDRARVAPGPTYTIDTVRRLRSILPKEIKIRLLIGSDQAADFYRWRNARELEKQTRPITLMRAPHRTIGDLSAAIRAPRFWTSAHIANWLARVPLNLSMEGSSTDARDLLRNTSPTPEQQARLDELLTPAVHRYIREHGLYR